MTQNCCPENRRVKGLHEIQEKFRFKFSNLHMFKLVLAIAKKITLISTSLKF